jgi:thioesterase domain-containing protein
VIVHPGALPTSVYDRLVDQLPADYAVHLLDLQGLPQYQQAALNGGRSELAITDIAESFAQLVRQLLGADESYVLLGWSFGGVIAHAMTRHLTGPRTPAHLILLDSIAAVPGYQAKVEDLDDRTLFEWFCMYLGAKRGVPILFEESGLDTLDEVLAAMIAAGALLPGTTAAGLTKVFGVYVDGLRRNSLLTRAYHAMPSEVSTTAVRARRSLLAEQGPLGWDRICPLPVPVLTVDGDHYSMLTETAATAMLAALTASVLPLDTQPPVAAVRQPSPIR